MWCRGWDFHPIPDIPAYSVIRAHVRETSTCLGWGSTTGSQTPPMLSLISLSMERVSFKEKQTLTMEREHQENKASNFSNDSILFQGKGCFSMDESTQFLWSNGIFLICEVEKSLVLVLPLQSFGFSPFKWEINYFGLAQMKHLRLGF